MKLISKNFSGETKNQKLPDVRQICESLRSQVLAGCRLVLSGVVPNNMRPDDHRFVKNAKLLGAEIRGQIDDQTTHLVCTRIGTTKYREAKKKNITVSFRYTLTSIENTFLIDLPLDTSGWWV